MKRIRNLVYSKKCLSLVLLFAGFALVSTDSMTAHASNKSSDVPPVGQDWIKVKLPLEMSYRSTSDSNHKDISSDKYQVENLSDYPVAVSYTGFVGKDGSSNPITTGVQNLNLVLSDGYKFILVENGKATDYAKTKLYELGARSGTPVSGNFNKPSSEVIRFSGSTQSNIDSSRLIIQDNQLNFELSLLDPNGQIPKDQTSIKVKDSEIALGSSWNSNDNYVDGTDDMGKPLDINKVTIGGDKVDTNKPGVYKVTYSYRNITQTANVTVKDLTSIKVHDSMVNVGESWKALDNFDSATNEYGQPIDIGKITVDGSDIDTNAPGTYNVNYSYHNVIQTAKVVVNVNITFMNQAWDIIKGPNKMGDGNYLVASQQSLGDKDFASRDYYYISDIATTDGYQDSDAKSVVDQWYNDNIKGTVYENYIQPVMLLNPTLGDMINLGWVNNSDGHSATGLLTINQPDAYPTKIDYTKGNRQAFLMSGSDVSDGKGEFGNLTPAALSHEKILISKNFNNFWLRTPGEYFNLAGRVRSDKQTLWDNFVYKKNEVIPSLVIHVGKDYIQVKDSTIDPKSVWKPSDNFINATDESGNTLPFTKVTVGGDKVDTDIPGTYNVTYSYGNALQTAKVIVKNLTGIKVHDSTIAVGNTWTPSNNFDGGTDELGQSLDISKVTVGGDKVDTNKPGTYKVTYSYRNVSQTANVTVLKDQISITVKNSSIFVDNSWSPKDNFVSGIDELGQKLDLSKVKVSGTVDTATPGTYKVTYSYRNVSQTANVTISGELNFMNQMWDIIKGPNKMGAGNYLIAMQKSIGSSKFNSTTGRYYIKEDAWDGYLDSDVKPIVDNWYNNNIKGTTYEKFIQPVYVNNPRLSDMKKLGWISMTDSGANPTAAFISINQPNAYPTTVNTSGKKQAFLMSGSDVSNGLGTYGDLIPSVKYHLDKLQRNGTGLNWLRSPGYIYDEAAQLYPGYGSVGNYKVTNNNEIVPSIVVNNP